MEHYESYLLYLIEEVRWQLNELAKNKSLVDPEVVELSQRLDKLLNDYNAIMLGKYVAS